MNRSSRVLVTVLVVGSLAGCQGSPSLQLEYPGTAVKSVIPDMELHEAMTFGDIPLCIDGAGTEPARIDSVEAPAGSTLEITAFSVSDEMDGFGNDRVTLEGAGFDPEHRDLTRRCDGEPGRLIVEGSRSSAESASADELIVRYSAADGGSERSVQVPYAIVLCAPDELKIQDC